MLVKKILFATVIAVSTAAVPAFAADPAPATSVSQLWASISFADTIAAVFGIGALVIGVDLATLGYQKVRRLVKGAH